MSKYGSNGHKTDVNTVLNKTICLLFGISDKQLKDNFWNSVMSEFNRDVSVMNTESELSFNFRRNMV